jgi:hypothetical protein
MTRHCQVVTQSRLHTFGHIYFFNTNMTHFLIVRFLQSQCTSQFLCMSSHPFTPFMITPHAPRTHCKPCLLNTHHRASHHVAVFAPTLPLPHPHPHRRRHDTANPPLSNTSLPRRPTALKPSLSPDLTASLIPLCRTPTPNLNPDALRTLPLRNRSTHAPNARVIGAFATPTIYVMMVGGAKTQSSASLGI